MFGDSGQEPPTHSGFLGRLVRSCHHLLVIPGTAVALSCPPLTLGPHPPLSPQALTLTRRGWR